MKKVLSKLTFFLILLLPACSDLIEYSPYDTDISITDYNASAISEITEIKMAHSDTLKFAVISDIHENYDNMSDALARINKMDDIQFVICLGDITNSGLAQEFDWYINIAKESVQPVITLIGNHDYRSNGYSIFSEALGPSNFSFIAGKYKFILFDNVIWENSNLSPDYEWLTSELSDTGYNNIVACHIPPYAAEMEGIHNLVYNQIVNSNNTILGLHGHLHCYTEKYYNNIHILVSAAINDNEFYTISLINNQSIIKCIKY